MADPLDRFHERLVGEWLPAFREDPKRDLSDSVFVSSVAAVLPLDAENFMRALDSGVAYDDGGGRYRSAIKGAYEHLFNHGLRKVVPRQIRLSLEPIMTIAALGRLHLDYGWPKTLLGLQPAKGEFDFAAYRPGDTSREFIAGEVKKTVREAENLLVNLENATHSNADKKFGALLDRQAPYFWVVGPGGWSRLFEVTYPKHRCLSRSEVDLERLQYVF